MGFRVQVLLFCMREHISQVTPTELVDMILTYCSAAKMSPVRPEDLVQSCRRSFKLCRHFVDTVLEREAHQGLLACQQQLLRGSVEVDATSIGKWWVPRSDLLMQDQIQALEKRSKRHPAYPVHWRILGAKARRTGRIVVKFLRPVVPGRLFEPLSPDPEIKYLHPKP